MLKHSMLVKAGLVLVVCSITPTLAFSTCAPPPSLQAKVRAHPNADTYIEIGSWFGDKRQFACAVDSFQAATKYEPDSARLAYLIGLSYYSEGKADQAVISLQRSIELSPKVLKPHLLLGAALSQLGSNKEAETQWEAALQIEPSSAVALDGLSKTLMVSGDNASVIGLLRSASRDENLTLDLALAYSNLRLYDEATELLNQGLAKTADSPRLTKALAGILVVQSRYQEAAKLAEKAALLHPRDLGAQTLYLRMLVLNGELDVARPIARKQLVIAPHDFDILYLNGVLEREAGEYPAARAHLEEAVSLIPNHYNSRYNLGVVLAHLQDAKGAREQLEKALALGAAEPQVRFELASVLRSLGEKDLAAQQLLLYQKEFKAKADRTLAAGKSAEAAQASDAGDAAKAASLYKEAFEATPQDALLAYKMAIALDRAGDLTAERVALEQAVKLDPELALAQNQLGYLASRSGENATAEEHFRAALRSAPGFTQAWLSLAATLGMESRFPEAQEAVANALKLDPANSDAKQLTKDLATAQAQQ